MFLQEISSQPYCKRSFLNIKGVRPKMITPAIFLFSTPPNFQELVTSTAFDGSTGIQSTNEMDVRCPNHCFILVPSPIRKRVIYNKVFVLLIPRCSASFSMLPIGTSGVGLIRNTEPLGVTLRSILD